MPTKLYLMERGRKGVFIALDIRLYNRIDKYMKKNKIDRTKLMTLAIEKFMKENPSPYVS